MLRYLHGNFHQSLVKGCFGAVNSLALPTCLAEGREMQDMLNEWLVRARGCGDIDNICFGVPLHCWNPLITHIRFSESYHCFFKVMPGLHLFKKIIIAIEFVGQARVSPTAIFPKSASDNHHYISLPLLPISPHLDHHICWFTLLGQWSHWDVRPWGVGPLTVIPLSEHHYFYCLFMVITIHEGIKRCPGKSLESQAYSSLLPLCSSNSNSSVEIRVHYSCQFSNSFHCLLDCCHWKPQMPRWQV